MKIYPNKLGLYKGNTKYFDFHAIEYACSNRKARCRTCAKTIPAKCNRLRVPDIRNIPSRYGWHSVWCVDSYCPKCAKEKIKYILEGIKDIKKSYNQSLRRIAKEDMKGVDKLMKQIQLVEQI